MKEEISAIDRHADRKSNDENLNREEKEEPYKARQLGALQGKYKGLNNFIIP